LSIVKNNGFMNLIHLNLADHGISDDAEIQIPVFLIAEELKARKLLKALKNIGCDDCFCVTDLCDLVLAYVGFDDRPNNLYDFYFALLDRHCEKVNLENKNPVREALKIFTALLVEKERQNTKPL
jgi:hypothetical protein